MKTYEVVAAVIKYDGKILCMQRNKSKYTYTSYKFEFPGGKIEIGETPTKALKRELQEEMAMEVDVQPENYLLTVEHTYPDFAIKMQTFLCEVSSPEFIMKEHVAYKWLLPEEMSELDWAAADIPIVKFIQEKF